MSIRVRFAPSPTGFLHVGGARTALFNWLLARQQGGVFVLRVEDTDRERSSPEMTQAILDSMKWLGLDWDEGPHFQSEGIARHRANALRLLEDGSAYRDFSTSTEIEEDQERDRAGGRPSRAQRARAEALGAEASAARAAAGEPFAVRLRVREGTIEWDDDVHGTTSFAAADIDDFVLLRSDGSPTYNFAVVSDDVEMRITQVIRGDDHLSNTPKQILVYEALGHAVPRFGHVPMILGPDGRRLSKRHGATAVGEYEEQGILPDALINFLALLGWSPGDDREKMTRGELRESFSMARVLKKSSVFDAEKLLWLNGRYLAEMSGGELAPLVLARLQNSERPERRSVAALAKADSERFERLVGLLGERSRTVDEVAELTLPYLGELSGYDEGARSKAWKHPAEAVRILSAVTEILESAEWTADIQEAELRALAARMEIGAGKLFQPLRLALTGTGASPGIFDVLDVVGRERSLDRLRRAVAVLNESSEQPEGEIPDGPAAERPVS